MAYTENLNNVDVVGRLDISCVEGHHDIIRLAYLKHEEVLRGNLPFGRSVVIPSFEAPSYGRFDAPATIRNVFLLHALCKPNVLDTIKGIVSVFPITVYNSVHLQQQKKSGYAVIAIHQGHMTRVLTRMYSVLKSVYSAGKFHHLHEYCCKFHELEDAPLITVSGLERHSHTESRARSGFLLIPALWFDVMKYFFVHSHSHRPYDIGVVLRNCYSHNLLYGNMFEDIFRCIWLGEERKPNVIAMVKYGMARCRALNDMVRVQGQTQLWSLPTRKVVVRYDDMSFAYGVSCWPTQLSFLNTMFIFFRTSVFNCYDMSTLNLPCHMHGVLHLRPNEKVLTRPEAIEQGIHNDYVKYKIDPAIRRQRYVLRCRYGLNSTDRFWGEPHEYDVHVGR
jgi:hypothetical protein